MTRKWETGASFGHRAGPGRPWTRKAMKWSFALPLAVSLVSAPNSADGTCCPNLSPDQHLLYFASNRPGGFGYRPGGLGDYNLWVSYRADTNDDFGWGPPSNLGPLVHKVGAGECAPTIFKDEQTGITNLYFCRNQ